MKNNFEYFFIGFLETNEEIRYDESDRFYFINYIKNRLFIFKFFKK